MAAAILVMVVLVVSSVGYFQFVYAPTVPTSTATSAAPPPNIKTITINITLNAASDCGGASGGNGSQPSTCNAYSPNPARLVLGVNNSVAFDNVDSAVHTATAYNNAFNTGILNGGQSSSPIVITSTGTYAYFCQIHPWMKGEIIVVAGPAASGA